MENYQTSPGSAYRPREDTQLSLTEKTVAGLDAEKGGVMPVNPLRARLSCVGSPLSSFGASSSSSFSTRPPLSSTNVTSPSSLAKQSPDPFETTPEVVDSSVPVLEKAGPPPVSGTNLPASSRSGESSAASVLPRSSDTCGSGASESEGHVGPTRASIRAWARATPAGPPQGPPPSRMPEHLRIRPDPGSGSDDNLSRASLTRSAGAHARSPESSIDPLGPGSGEESPDEAEGSSGNVADAESSGSERACRSPPASTPHHAQPSSAVQRESLAPYPHSHADVPPYPLLPHPRHHAHHPQAPRPRPRSPPLPQSHSSSDSQPPATPIAHQDDRRQHRHSHSGRRRQHRERERERDRDRCSHPPAFNPSTAPPAAAAAPAPGLASFCPRPSTRAPAQPPARPLKLISGGNSDVFDDMVKLLVSSRQPLLRAGGAGDGWTPHGARQPRRENDVLDDVWQMVQWSARHADAPLGS
ncbi:hypothetical protein OH77DRAFT_1241304 [Trametes cingulata]|nr:hypothetical protein OH77DRAFT_1241304 [Trametes cingulata]